MPIPRILLVALVAALLPAGSVRADRWLSVSYRDALDLDRKVRTGETLGDAMPRSRERRELKAAIQPFADRYTFLLQQSVEMIAGPDTLPHHDIADHFPAGAAQPAWVALFRSGRYFAAVDNARHARLFLPGSTASSAYKEHYPAVRHALAALAAGRGPIRVEVYAFENDYATGEFRLNRTPHVFDAAAFPAPTGRDALDLASLSGFFEIGGVPDAARLEKGKGLLLAGPTSERATLAGQPLALSDLAAAYRAVFHAGANEAFISLDPHDDPAKIAVNFGGFLENTRIGSVVLEADKRFKTISTGIDPNSFRDIRGDFRRVRPSFMTSAERDLASGASAGGDWIGTRFWFYPESVEIETDDEYRLARVARARFTADAERKQQDFADPAEFERLKKAMLKPSIRRNIDDLNENYDQYAQAFPELRELGAVARLMGICSWLRRARKVDVDLDALLSVELPAFRTPKEKTPLLASSTYAQEEGEGLDPDAIRDGSKVHYFSAALDKPIRGYFGGDEGLARYLAVKHAYARKADASLDEKEAYRAHLAEAKKILANSGGHAVRSLIRSEADLKALAWHATGRLQSETQAAANALDKEIDGDKAELDRRKKEIETFKAGIDALKAEMNRLKARMDKLKGAADPAEYNRLVDEYNADVKIFNAKNEEYARMGREHGEAHDAVNEKIRRYNGMMKYTYHHAVTISGGIDLGPSSFTVRKVSAASLAREIDGMIASASGTAGRMRSDVSLARAAVPAALPTSAWNEPLKAKTPEGEACVLRSDVGAKYTVTEDPASGTWKDRFEPVAAASVSREYDPATKTLTLVREGDDAEPETLKGTFENADRIVFRIIAETAPR